MKYIFVGDADSINIEIISKAFKILKNSVNYIIIGNFLEIKDYLLKIKSPLTINLIQDPINFYDYNHKKLNLYNIDNISKQKYKNLINQINISNFLAKKTGFDLITMPVNKHTFKKKLNFIGMTEHLGKINKKNTIMLMHGERFSVIPLTTHINLKDIKKYINKKFLSSNLTLINKQIKRRIYELNFKSIKFLCYNPHCSEENTIGNEDRKITKIIKNFKNIYGPFSADSAFNNIHNDLLFISMYHDQALIPFKILNKKGINLTLGLNYKRLSPAHGTARDIKFKNMANLSSYLACMDF